ncbi:MAG: hypothetical protein C0504_20190 [Candidatus Solibacter sp.]|nr:hypothetical protein [Candidatus Solibacter sp.]
MCFAATRGFKTFSPAKLHLGPGFIVKDGSRFVLLMKDNSRPNLNLRVAFGDNPLGPWRGISEPFTGKFTEGPAALKVGQDWLIYFDMYRANRYGAVRTRNVMTCTGLTAEVSFPHGHKHGTVCTIERRELDRLLK